jgi:hypothetical protein
MKTKFGSKGTKRIMELIGESSLGCLENSYIPVSIQRRIPGLLAKRPLHPAHRIPRRWTPAPR